MTILRSEKEGYTIACPECDKGGNVYERQGHGNTHAGDADMPYICGKCSATFENYVERETYGPHTEHIRQSSSMGLTGLTKKLFEMDADDI